MSTLRVKADRSFAIINIAFRHTATVHEIVKCVGVVSFVYTTIVDAYSRDYIVVVGKDTY